MFGGRGPQGLHKLSGSGLPTDVTNQNDLKGSRRSDVRDAAFVRLNCKGGAFSHVEETLTFSQSSLALALGLCSTSAGKAGGLFHGHGDDCLASPQGTPVVSPLRAPCASPQGECVNEEL